MELDLATVSISTSYFSMVKYVTCPVNIAGQMPKWAEKFGVRKFPHLAAKYETYKKYKDGLYSEQDYTEEYTRTRLSRWDSPLQLVEELVTHFGLVMTLICWERPGMFCHRRIVADFIQSGTPLIVKEWDSFDDENGIEIKSRSR